MQFFARFEAHGFTRGYADFGTGAGIAADTGFAGTDAENAETAEFDALAGGEGLFEALEDRIHRCLCLRPRQACALDYMMDDVLFDQRGDLAGATGLNVLRLTVLMLQVLPRFRNSPKVEIRIFKRLERAHRCAPSQKLMEILEKSIGRLSIGGRVP
jgi:hypothetical protein